MEQLRIVEVSHLDETDVLIVSDAEGQEFALPVDEALRSAAARPSLRPHSGAAEHQPTSLSPRDIQARLRAGSSVEQLVKTSGQDTEYIERYAGPVYAERAYVAARARSTELGTPSPYGYRSASAQEPQTLETTVTTRFRQLDIDPDSATWDAWRLQDGAWLVDCHFDLPNTTQHDSGEEPRTLASTGSFPPAQWRFSPETRHLSALNPWAESLISTHAHDAHPSGRRLSAVDSPFDIENQPAAKASTTATVAAFPGSHSTASEDNSAVNEQDADHQLPPTAESTNQGSRAQTNDAGAGHEELLDVLRARRGKRLGADTDSDDALALMLTRDETGAQKPATRPQGPELRAVEKTDGKSSDERGNKHSGSTRHSQPALTGPLPGLDAQMSSDTSNNKGKDTIVPDAPADTTTEPAQHKSRDGHASSDATEDPTGGQGKDAWGFTYEDSPEAHQGADVESDAQTAEIKRPEAANTTGAVNRSSPSGRKKNAKRATMPAWDDILFGSKDD